jgi:hypothetical protein
MFNTRAWHNKLLLHFVLTCTAPSVANSCTTQAHRSSSRQRQRHGAQSHRCDGTFRRPCESPITRGLMMWHTHTWKWRRGCGVVCHLHPCHSMAAPQIHCDMHARATRPAMIRCDTLMSCCASVNTLHPCSSGRNKQRYHPRSGRARRRCSLHFRGRGKRQRVVHRRSVCQWYVLTVISCPGFHNQGPPTS